MAKRYYESKEERRDSGMLNYDYSAVANMPQGVKYHSWAERPGSLGDASPELDDTIRGVDKLINEDVAKGKKHKQYNKW
jgi:hypothetical protein